MMSDEMKAAFFDDERGLAELGRLYNCSIGDDSRQFTRWQMIVAMNHGARLAIEATTVKGDGLERWEVRPCYDPTGKHLRCYDICLPCEPGAKGAVVVASVFYGKEVAEDIARRHNEAADTITTLKGEIEKRRAAIEATTVKGGGLVERLRAVESSGKYTTGHGNDVTTIWYRNPDGPEAADMITTLKGEIERRDDALRAIRRHCEPQPSPLAKAIVATCDNALGSTDNVG